MHTGTHRYTHTHMLPLHGIDLPSLIDGAQSKIDNKYSTSIFITHLCRGCCYSLPWCSSEHCACPTLRSSILTGVCVCVCVCLCMCVCVCVRASAYECVLLISFIWWQRFCMPNCHDIMIPYCCTSLVVCLLWYPYSLLHALWISKGNNMAKLSIMLSC